jgi:threonine dehydrogenase-like Zn-dependent dehydrogenase
MRAVAVFPARRQVRVVDHPEPKLTPATQARMRVLDVGVCGTDRDIVLFQYGTPPDGSDYLIIGHESLSGVVEAGPQVSKLKPGDLVAMTVRRPCAHPSSVARREGPQAFQSAIRHLGIFAQRWPETLRSVITARFPLERAMDALKSQPGGVKNVVAVAS